MAIEHKKLNDREMLTGEVRISYPHVFTPTGFKDGDKKSFSVVLLIPKGDPQLKMIKGLIDKAARVEWPETGIPKKGWDPLRDGDDEDDHPEYAGHFFMNAKSSEKRPPVVVDRNKNEIMDQREIYAGCYCRAKISAFAFTKAKSKLDGVSINLNLLQKLRDGEPFGGSSKATTDDLDDLEPVSTGGGDDDWDGQF